MTVGLIEEGHGAESGCDKELDGPVGVLVSVVCLIFEILLP